MEEVVVLLPVPVMARLQFAFWVPSRNNPSQQTMQLDGCLLEDLELKMELCLHSTYYYKLIRAVGTH